MIFLGERASRRQLWVAVSWGHPEVVSFTTGVLRGSFVSEHAWSRRKRWFYQASVILGRLLLADVHDCVLFDSIAVIGTVLLFLLFLVVFAWGFTAAKKFAPVVFAQSLPVSTRRLLLAHLYIVELLFELGWPAAFFTWRTGQVPIRKGSFFGVADFLAAKQLHFNLAQFVRSFSILSLIIFELVRRIFNIVVIIL